MTSRADKRRAGGFTLIEMLVVLAVLGMALALVVARGPARSRGLDLTASASDLAEALRSARARAIAENRMEQVVIDAETHRVLLPGARIAAIPTETVINFHTLAGPVAAPRLAIRFAPDGSSNGGAVELSGGGRRLRVGAAWLSGRVSVTDAP